MSAIELKHIYKDYVEGQHVVTDFNLQIEEGEFIVLVGPSGCGKSTTLRMIAGLEEITSGELYFDGKLMNDVVPKDRDIAMVFQNYALYPHMNVAENMGFGLKMKKVNKDEIEQRVKETSKIIGMDDYLDRLPKELSGGQRQRVALGRAIVRKPKVFLMDEPLSNLDAKLRVQTRAEITQIAKGFGNTTIYVTHDQVEAMTMADRIVLMKDGFIQQVSSPREIYLHPENKFVAGFMGSPAMNFIDVTVTKVGIEHGSMILEIPEDIKEVLIQKGYENRKITLGIRPENIILEKDAPEDIKKYGHRAKIRLAEMLGSETLLHFDMIEGPMIAKIYTLDNFRSGEELNICLDYNFVHFFDIDTQKRVEVPSHGSCYAKAEEA